MLYDAVVPAIIAGVLIYSVSKKNDVFALFIQGAKGGMTTVLGIMPTLIGLIVAVYMLRASGAIDIFSHFLSPIMEMLGIPKELSTLVLLKPISGSGGLAIGTEIMDIYGVDSVIGTTASVMLAASETSIYTLSVYYGYLKITDTRDATIAALSADLMAFVASAFFVKLFLV